MSIIKKIRKLYMILKHPFYAAALRWGVAAAIEHEAVLKAFKYQVLVDIGANRGQFSLVARRCQPQARIYSFEPLAGPALNFQRIFKRDKRTELYPYAIGPRREIANIHISKRDDSSSLLPITSAQTKLFPGTDEAGIQEIQVVPLGDVLSESMLETPAMLKLDVQGYEKEVLLGCEDLLAKFQYVYVECSFRELYEGQALADEVINHMRERGFKLIGVYNMSYDNKGIAVQADFLFSKV